MANIFQTGDRCNIAWQIDGPECAPVLLLSNSLGTNLTMWDAQIDAWSSHFRILRYDSRGHGLSEAPVGAYSMDRLGRDAVELLDHLELDIVHFCGLSLGGMVGQWLAVRASERLGKLVLANTSAYMGPPSGWQARIETVFANGMEGLAEASIGRWFTPGFGQRAPAAVDAIRDGLRATNPVGYAGCCAAIRDMDQRSTATLNTVPTLVIAGDQDPATPVSDGAFLVEAALEARLETVAAAHLSNVEAPNRFSELVIDFLLAP